MFRSFKQKYINLKSTVLKPNLVEKKQLTITIVDKPSSRLQLIQYFVKYHDLYLLICPANYQIYSMPLLFLKAGEMSFLCVANR